MKMKNKKNILEEIKKDGLKNESQNSQILSKIKKENHFSTPKNYFESLPEIINDKKLNNNSLKLIFDKLSYRLFIPISALTVLFFVVFNFNTKVTSTELTHDQLSEIIIEEDYLDLDDYLVYEAYAEILEEEKNETTTDNEYINYLIENDIDINSIIEEL